MHAQEVTAKMLNMLPEIYSEVGDGMRHDEGMRRGFLCMLDIYGSILVRTHMRSEHQLTNFAHFLRRINYM